MHKTAYKLIAEGFREIYEASTSGDIVNSLPGGPEIMQALHTTQKAPHNLNYTPVPKISWAEIKGAYSSSWILIQADKGTGAIKFQGDTYSAMASTGQGVEQFSNTRSGFVVDWLKGKIGGLRKFYVARGQADVTKVQRDRKSRQPNPEAEKFQYSERTSLQKFRPLIAKTIEHAVADIRGMAQTMLKNGNYDGAQKKIQKLQKYDEILFKLQNKNADLDNDFTTKMNDAIVLTAHHFYPEQTGEVSRGGYGSRGLRVENQQGTTQLFNDINSGDTAKLSTLLAFFKRGFTA